MDHERLVAELYRQFERRCSEHAEFWHELVNQEHGHVCALNRLLDLVVVDDAALQNMRVPPSEIELHDQFVLGQIDFESDDPIAPQDAFRIAVLVENSMIEKHFFRSFESDSPEAAKLLQLLAEETAEHLERIEKHAERVFRGKGWLSRFRKSRD